MRNLFRVMVLFWASGLMLGDGGAFAQKPPTGFVRGVVVLDLNGGAEPGVAVTISGETGQYQETAITDLAGVYSFSAPPGTYTLTVRPPKPLLLQRSSPVVVNAGQVTSHVTRLEFNPNADKFSPGPANETKPADALPSLTQLELLHGTSASAAPPAEKDQHASFSLGIRIIGNKKRVAPGEAVKLSITMKNVTPSEIFFDVGTSVPQMIGVLPLLADAHGQPVRLTEQGKLYFYDQSNSYDLASDHLAPLEPGKTVTWEIELNKLFDMSHPGRFEIQAVRRDPQTKTLVKSNSLKLKLTR